MTAAARARRRAPEIQLSPRQYEVAVLLRAGMSRSEVARELGVTGNTVKTLTTAVYRALGVRSREELAHASFGPWPDRRCAICRVTFTPARQAQRFCSDWCANVSSGAAS